MFIGSIIDFYSIVTFCKIQNKTDEIIQNEIDIILATFITAYKALSR